MYRDEPNRGVYSKGRSNFQDPFMFTKISTRPVKLENDAYYNYVQAIKPYISSNPYLPRVYVIKTDIDSEGRAIPKYQMEKLFNLTDFDDEEELKPIGEKIFTNPPSNIIDTLKSIRRALENGIYAGIKDKKLIQALQIIKQVHDSSDYKFYYDLHDGNFLFRKGPYGIQLVISDPLGDLGD